MKHPRLAFKFEDMDKISNHKELGYNFKKECVGHAKYEEIVLVLKGRPAESYKAIRVCL